VPVVLARFLNNFASGLMNQIGDMFEMLVVLFCFILLIGGLIVAGLCRREFIRFVLVNKFFIRGLFRIR
jgi:hypothetical protein